MAPKDIAAAKEFIEEVSGLIGSLLWKNFPHLPREEKEDITQEVQVKLWKLIKSGRKIRNLKSYLWRMAYTTALDVIDSRVKENQLGENMLKEAWNSLLPEDMRAADSVLEKKELQQVVERAIEGLGRNRRSVMKLHLTGMSIEEIADFLGWTESKVNHLFYRSRDDLKRRLKTRKGHF